MSPDQLVTLNLERWKEHLLDTSKRNRLLHFQPNSAVQLVEPELKVLWNKLVARPNLMTFFGQEVVSPDLFSESESDDEDFAPPRRNLKADEIRTDPTGVKLSRALYTLRSKSNLSLEEQGLTTLYVAWGFLKWRDVRTSEEIVSPLILSPMTLLRESSRAPYRVKLSEEDLWLNPVLKWKLAADFRIELPPLPAYEDTDLFAYFAAVRAAIKKQSGWGIWEAAYLGLFSFHKMKMYEDLDEGGALALGNPFVRALGGDPSRLPTSPANLPSGAELDSLPIGESLSVLDCDSSQSESIQAAQAGVSFVLQGPPGTGKSQTITNIIAHCVAQGKRVLFVSEKMAALDVVHSRLEQVGLGLFCLKAHSQSATKKEVIADLGRTLAAARTGTQSRSLQNALHKDGMESAEIERLRAGLNRYVNELHSLRSPLGRSIYQITGELAQHTEAVEIAASLPCPGDAVIQSSPEDSSYRMKRRPTPFEVSAEELEEWRELLMTASHLEDVWSEGASHPWYNAAGEACSLDLLATIRMRSGRALALCHEVESKGIALAERCGVAVNDLSLVQAEALPELSTLLSELDTLTIKRPPAMWFVFQDLEAYMTSAAQFKGRFEAVAGRRAAIESRYQKPFWNLDHAQLIERATTRHESTLERCGTWEKFPDWSPETIQRLDTFATNLEAASRLAYSLATELGLSIPNTLGDLGNFANALMILRNEFSVFTVPVARHWFDESLSHSLRTSVEDATTRAKIRDESATLLGDYELEVMALANLEEMRGRFESDYGSFLRFLKGAYRQDARQMRLWRKDKAKTPYEKALTDLQVAARWQQSEQWFQANAQRHTEQFGGAYRGKQTPWPTIEENLGRCERTRAAFAPIGGLSLALFQKIERGEDLQLSLAFLPELCAALTVLREELPWLQVVLSLQNLPFQNESGTLSLAQAPAIEVAKWLMEQANALRDIQDALDNLMSVQRQTNTSPTYLIACAREALEVFGLEAELEGESELLRSQFDWLFEGANTDWDAVLSALAWTKHALDWWKKWAKLGGATGEDGQALGPFVAFASGQAPRPAGPDNLSQTEELRQEWQYFDALFLHSLAPSDSLQQDATWFEVRSTRASDLEQWLRWASLSRDLQSRGLWEFWEAGRRADLGGKPLLDAFERRFWSLWLDSALQQASALLNFDSLRHNAAAQRFAELDAASLRAAERRVSEALWNRKPVPTVGASKTGEIATLQKEAHKKARQKPLRRLFREIPHLLGALKPCLLMSPLSVAQFLEAGRAEFDVVIFDEASQICPEDAVGAILRAQQIVVVGDRKQLPPTRFFASGGIVDVDEDEEGAEDSSLFESILDMCAPHLPGYMLLWHYRSRNEALISFSNRNFYDGRLITFPNPHQGSERSRGVRLESVRGVYYRGKGKDARTNPIEAERVADLVIEHFKSSPGQSLGVIALNATQARAIDEAVARRLSKLPELEQYASPTRKERFFVKALENVQGDERDVIFLSIAYGPDQDGKISMNFGPLNKEGGERRLNVAVTRARDALTVVSSLQSDQIDTSRTSALGPRLLRDYLEMARRGGYVSDMEQDLESDKLVDAVQTALSERGWKIQRSIGTSALKIDLAVEHPTRSGEFLLGIECDGGDYQSSPTARDRERLRPTVLQGLGWKLERMWSLDWLKNPQGEAARLHALLQKVLEEEKSTEASPSATSSTAQQTVELNSAVTVDWEFDGESSAESLDEPGPEFTFESESPKLHVYETVNLGHWGWPDQFGDSSRLREAIWRVVQVEGPIRLELLQQRIAKAWGFQRSGSSIAATINQAVSKEQRVQARGSFVWATGQTDVQFRVPSPGDTVRPIEFICSEEIASAVLHCVREAFGVEGDELVRQTARLLGFARTGVQVEVAITSVLHELLKRDELVDRGGAIGLGNEMR